MKLTIPPAKATLYGTLPLLGLFSVAFIWGLVSTFIMPALEAPAGMDYLLLLFGFMGLSLVLKVVGSIANKLLQTKTLQAQGDELIIESQVLRFKPQQEARLTLDKCRKITLTSRQLLGESAYEAITGINSNSNDETEYNIHYVLILELEEDKTQVIHESKKLAELSPIFDWLCKNYPSLEAENKLADEAVLAQHRALQQAGKRVFIAFACVLLSFIILGYQWGTSKDTSIGLLLILISGGFFVHALIKAKRAKFQ